MDLKNQSIRTRTMRRRQHIDTGWAWIILLASFMINTLRAGVFTSVGLFLVPWQEQLSGSVTKLQWTISLIVGIPFLIGPVTNALCKFHSIRHVVIVGAIFTCSAFFAGWFATSVSHLYVCFAIAGIGFGLYYQPSLIILAYYFEKRLARANGISAAGIGIGNFAFPPLLQTLIGQYGWNGALLVLSGIVANAAVFGALYRESDLELTNRRGMRKRNDDDANTSGCQIDNKTVQVLELTRTSSTQSIEFTSTGEGKTQNSRSEEELNRPSLENQSVECSNDGRSEIQNANSGLESSRINENQGLECSAVRRTQKVTHCNSGFVADIMTSFNFHLLLDARFIPLFLSNCPYGIGYTLVMVYLPAMAIQSGIPHIKAAFLLSIVGVFSVVVRFTHGFLIDSNILSASTLTAMSFLLTAIATALIPVSSNYTIIAFLSALVGIGSGVFSSTVPVVAKEYVGVNRVSGAVGLLMLSTGTGVFLGLFITGILYDATGSYTLAFLFAGASFLISSILLFVDPLVKHFLKPNQ